MLVLKNQTIYQCEYCGKRLLSKNGAKIHEEIYCSQSPIVKQRRIDEVKACVHKMETQWSPMFGESHLLEPDYDYCIKCNAPIWEIREIEGDYF